MTDDCAVAVALAPNAVFAHAGISLAGSVPWGQPVRSTSPGIYVVSTSEDPNESDGLRQPPISAARTADWIAACPNLTIHGTRPTAQDLASHLGAWWLPTAVLYIGLTTQPLRTRVGSYYSTPLGAEKPHAGGNWIQTLEPDVLAACWVHVAPIAPEIGVPIKSVVEDAERRAQVAFMTAARPTAPATHPEPDLALPFANLQVVVKEPGALKGVKHQRKHGIVWRASTRSAST